MMTMDMIRAWKDEDYRAGLSQEQLAQLPAHPAGGVEVQQSDRNIFEIGRRTLQLNCTRKSHGC